MSDIEIPYRITVFVYNKKNINGELVYHIFPYDTRRLGKKMRSLICEKQKSMNNINDDPIELVLDNKYFSLSIVDNTYSTVYARWAGGYQSVPVFLSHPELRKRFPGRKFMILTPLSDLTQYVYNNGVECGNIGGSYRILHTPYFSGYWGVKLISEDNDDTKEVAEVGKFMATTRKTSKWIPGHTYLLSNLRRILYLCDVDKIWMNNTHRFYSSCGAYLYFSSVLDRWNTFSYTTRSHHVVVDITNEESPARKILDSPNCPLDIETFVEILLDKWIEEFKNGGSIYRGSDIPLKVFRMDNKRAWDCGSEYFAVSNFDSNLKDIINSFCISHLPGPRESVKDYQFYLIPGITEKDVKPESELGKTLYRMALASIDKSLEDMNGRYYSAKKIDKNSDPEIVLKEFKSDYPRKFPTGMIDVTDDMILDRIKSYIKLLK